MGAVLTCTLSCINVKKEMILRSDSRPRTRLVLKQKKIKRNSIMTSSFKICAKSSAKLSKKRTGKDKLLQIVDSEISFNFNTPKKTEPGSEVKTEKEIEWLKTMVIIYDIIFDIKTEKKDDYEEDVNLYPKKKKKRRRFGRY